jgi:cytochrome c oxidase cbb3-type subunit I/II
VLPRPQRRSRRDRSPPGTPAYDDDIVGCSSARRCCGRWSACWSASSSRCSSPGRRRTGGNPYTTFGRLRPLHTNAVIFAFTGNICFTGIYYSMQRLLKVRMWNDTLSRLHFWGWQLIIVAAALTLPLGMTQGKEYAELIWPIDVLIAVVWVMFGGQLLHDHREAEGRAPVRRDLVLHLVRHHHPGPAHREQPGHAGDAGAVLPRVRGADGRLVQWWYGHNAVGFFLTTPLLGLMYYFLPRAAERPVYSYRLSIVHFWALVFLYIWAGPHHLLYSALPEWAQTLGMVFSIMLLAPSWGGMLNGLLTLRGAWDRVRTDPVLKFMVVAVSFYGMSTFEGPMMSIRAVNGSRTTRTGWSATCTAARWAGSA